MFFTAQLLVAAASIVLFDAEIFPVGGNVNILFIIFKLLTISVPSKIILHWANICFSEHDYFRDEQVEFSMNYKLCELYNKYTILSKYEKNNISFK